MANTPAFIKLDEGYSRGYQQGRRRWVPKGVMLLMFLFIIGVLNACTTAALPQQKHEPVLSEIALPVDQAVRFMVS